MNIYQGTHAENLEEAITFILNVVDKDTLSPQIIRLFLPVVDDTQKLSEQVERAIGTVVRATYGCGGSWQGKW